MDIQLHKASAFSMTNTPIRSAEELDFAYICPRLIVCFLRQKTKFIFSPAIRSSYKISKHMLHWSSLDEKTGCLWDTNADKNVEERKRV